MSFTRIPDLSLALIIRLDYMLTIRVADGRLILVGKAIRGK